MSHYLEMPAAITSEDHEDRSTALVHTLQQYGVFESEDELNHRLKVLDKLRSLVEHWMHGIMKERHVRAQRSGQTLAHVLTFGSYHLGVQNRGADIDVLCVAPNYITRADYFSSFFAVLKSQPDVSELRAVQDAYVPLIKMKLDGTEIDMTFACLALIQVANLTSLSDSSILKNVDLKCARSLNGRRVTDEILNQVPNQEVFRLTLRTIRLWAKKHGIYSNVLGFLGGASWALLVARVCQLFPDADPSTLVSKFFLVFLKWPWPQPVLLKKPEEAGLGFPVWDPRLNASDRAHLMPIITPVYPQQNSSFNVSKSTLEIIKEEFRQSLAICEGIMAGKVLWERLFETPNFFAKYRHFLVIEVSASSEKDLLEWSGLVESKIRHLVRHLESEYVNLAHVWPIPHPCPIEGREKLCCYWFVGLDIRGLEPVGLGLDLEMPIYMFCRLVNSRAQALHLYKDGMKVMATHKKRRHLASYIRLEERHKLKMSESPTHYSTAKRRPSGPDWGGAESDVNQDSGSGLGLPHSVGPLMDEQPPSKRSNSSPDEATTTALEHQ